jgi:hypothetical protein
LELRTRNYELTEDNRKKCAELNSLKANSNSISEPINMAAKVSDINDLKLIFLYSVYVKKTRYKC